MTPREKIVAIRDELKAAFVERDEAADALVVALLAKEHLFVLGKPGTAKSAMVRALCGAIDNAKYWEYLFTRFTEPNEVFGPIDLQAWSTKGDYKRRVDGFLPTAHLAFGDECFKANSSILNSMLALINERIYHDGSTAIQCPLQTMVGASNELPESAELSALFDRFLLRLDVQYVREEDSFASMLKAAENGVLPSITAKITLAELEQARTEVCQVTLSDAVRTSLYALRGALLREGIEASDRRWTRLQGVLKAAAYLAGDTEVSSLHFETLVHCLWQEPKEKSKIAPIVAKAASASLAEALEIHDAIMEQVNGLPPTGTVGTDGHAVAGALRKAIERVKTVAAAADAPVAKRIRELQTRLTDANNKLAHRIMGELGMSVS
jgi:MoxR-like ATPase